MDSTLIGVLAGGAIGAVTGAATAWITGHWNAKAADRQAVAQLDVLTHEHLQRSLEHRQRVYHDFLNILNRLEGAAAMAADREALDVVDKAAAALARMGGGPTVTPVTAGLAALPSSMLPILTTFSDHLNGLILFGTDRVRDAAKRLESIFRPGEERIRVSTLVPLSPETGAPQIEPFLDALTDTFHHPSWKGTLDDLEDAMRADVAP
jgi:hypothetical protein